MCGLCLALCSNLERKKAPSLLVVLNLPWAGSFTKSFSLFIAAQILRWGLLFRQKEKSLFFRLMLPLRGLEMLGLSKAENFHNPYLDTVENGSTLGNPHTHDTQADPEARLPTHTFPPCWNLRKSPKRPALPGAVIPSRRRSLAATLSPAILSTVGIRRIKGGYPYGEG